MIILLAVYLLLAVAVLLVVAGLLHFFDPMRKAHRQIKKLPTTEEPVIHDQETL